MQAIITKINQRYPELTYKSGDQFFWSPETREIYYNQASTNQNGNWSLLHETGHALLQHTNYQADVELLRLEVAAWEKARELASWLGFAIDEDHIQDCLDTYRDWLYKRSICPNCHTKCLQQDDKIHYRCFNCHTIWRVSTSRFCRAYRSTKDIPQTAKVFDA